MELYNAFRILGVFRYFLYSSGWQDTLIAALTVAFALIVMVVSYMLGGLNFAIIISKKKFGTDVREYGSGNAGMTNMHRTFGKKAGLIVLAGDAGKTFVSCLVGYLFLGRFGAFIAGLFCMLGHMFPIKYKFKGGKGVICVAVAVLMTDIGNPAVYFIPFLFIILFVIFAVIVLGTKYVSLGSVMCMLIYPVFLYSFEFLGYSAEEIVKNPAKAEVGYYVLIAFLMAAMVVFMHRQNIVRLWQGKESKFDLHMTDKKALYNKKENADCESASQETVPEAKKSKKSSKKK